MEERFEYIRCLFCITGKEREAARALEQIEGVGAKTIEALLRHFRTVEKVRAANWEELSALIGPAKARKVRAYFETGK